MEIKFQWGKKNINKLFSILKGNKWYGKNNTAMRASRKFSKGMQF